MAKQAFGGADKVGESFLVPLENRFKARWVDCIPPWLETYHLTLLTIVWSVGTVGFGFLARRNIHWLWMVSVMVIAQYLSDLFDGAVGRKRDTGLVKWGFFMDHFLDFVFLCSLITAYYLVAPPGYDVWFMALLGITGGHMVHSFLAFAATNEFRISFWGFGPTEMRIGFIGINAFIVLTYPRYYEWTIPCLTAGSSAALAVVAFRTHRRLWKIDMEAKRKKDAGVVLP